MKRKCKRTFYLTMYLCYLSILLPFTGIKVTSAAIFSGGFFSGRLSYAYEGDSSPYISNTAANQWNNISTNVLLYYTSATDSFGSSAKIITHFNTTAPPTSGALGITYPYRTWGISSAPATISERWVKAVVYQYKTTNLDTTTKRVATATHEIGHALSVAHPTSSTTVAVMKQGIKTFYELTSYDISSLINKWGE